MDIEKERNPRKRNRLVTAFRKRTKEGGVENVG